MSERDKFLTEAMGECWHDWMEDLDEYTDYTCTKCNKQEFNLKWDFFRRVCRKRDGR